MDFKPIEYIYRKTGEKKIEKVPGEKFLKFLYYSPFGELALSSVVKKKFLTDYYGKQMDKVSSADKIEKFIKSAEINIKESKKTVGEFATFNEFFIRELKPESRPIDKDENRLVSPADGKCLVYENLNDLQQFFIKGDQFNLKDFLKDDKLASQYEGGTLVIVRLAPVDYHRFHFPADGVINKTKKIEGYYYSVSTHAIRKNFRIYCENKREYSILKTQKFGNILMCDIAATMVGGIKQTYTPNSEVKKGNEKGYFYFGGSTTIMLFEKDKIQIDKDLIENSLNGIETKIYMGEGIGVSL
ncbi:MAG: phosphatidylserine decarboxylase [Fusobacteriaceae bacterium]